VISSISSSSLQAVLARAGSAFTAAVEYPVHPARAPANAQLALHERPSPPVRARGRTSKLSSLRRAFNSAMERPSCLIRSQPSRGLRRGVQVRDVQVLVPGRKTLVTIASSNSVPVDAQSLHLEFSGHLDIRRAMCSGLLVLRCQRGGLGARRM